MSKKMLIVDDEELVRMSISSLCKKFGFTSDSVESGKDALDKVKAGSYDAVIIDYNLGDINGEELLRQLKSSGGSIGKAILMSGTPNMEFQSKGFDFFLEKPIQNDHFKVIAEKI